MKDRLNKTWSLKVHKGEKHYRLRRFLWKLRFRFLPYKKELASKKQFTENTIAETPNDDG